MVCFLILRYVPAVWRRISLIERAWKRIIVVCNVIVFYSGSSLTEISAQFLRNFSLQDNRKSGFMGSTVRTFFCRNFSINSIMVASTIGTKKFNSATVWSMIKYSRVVTSRKFIPVRFDIFEWRVPLAQFLKKNWLVFKIYYKRLFSSGAFCSFLITNWMSKHFNPILIYLGLFLPNPIATLFTGFSFSKKIQLKSF